MAQQLALTDLWIRGTLLPGALERGGDMLANIRSAAMRWTAPLRSAWAIGLIVALLASTAISTGSVEAQETPFPPDTDVLIQVTLQRDEGADTGQFVVVVEGATVMPSTLSMRIDFDDADLTVVRSGDVPACAFGAPWIGSCGPTQPQSSIRMAAFTFLVDREVRAEAFVAAPVSFTSDDPMPMWTAEVLLVTDIRGEPMSYEIVEDRPVDEALVSISPVCDDRAFRVQSNVDVVAATVRTDIDQLITPVAVGDGVWHVVPEAWSEVMDVSVTTRTADGIEVTHTQGVLNGCDRDVDGTVDWIDNCPDDRNVSQADDDGDGLGDVCDSREIVCDDVVRTVVDSQALEFARVVANAESVSCGDVVEGDPNLRALDVVGLNADIDLTVFVHLEAFSATQSNLSRLTWPRRYRLSVVDLSDNGLTSWPWGLQLAGLHTLDLSDNQLTTLPDLTGPESLVDLDLSNNSLTQVPPFPYSLQRLQLQGNQLSGDHTYLFDRWYAVDRQHGDGGGLVIDDGPGFNDCVTTASPDVSLRWGLPRVALECEAGVAVEGQVRTPDGLTGVFGAEVCAERPLLETVCVFTNVFGFYRFDDLGQGNVRFSVTDPARRFEAPPTDFIGLVAGVEATRVDFDTVVFGVGGNVGVGGVDPAPTPEPTPTPDATPGPTPTPMPTPGPPVSDAMVGTISGRFFDDLGVPLAGAQVCAEVALLGINVCATTDGTGRFFFGGLASGNYVVAGYARGEIVDTYRYASVSPTQGVTGIELRDN